VSGTEAIPIVLGGEPMRGLVAAAARLEAARLGRFAIIGGVAVNARLAGGQHRATADLDAVVDDETAPDALEVLANLEDSEWDPTAQHRIYVGGTKIEIIGTQVIRDGDLDDLQDLEVLFVAGHRWALESATPLTLISSDSENRATVPVAEVGPLLAMKLHAIQDRRGTRFEKRSGDAWDIYRLLSEGLAGARLASQATKFFVAQRPRRLREATRSWCSRLGTPSQGDGWLAGGEDPP
jgi:hypothetical protein